MTDRPAPRYVVDLPLGGTMSLDGVIGGDGQGIASTFENPEERVWPDVPAEWEAPPARLDETIKEVAYISEFLRTIIVPTPLPNDNLELCSDILLSLETRDDISSQVLQYALVNVTLSAISQTCLIQNDSQFHIIDRVKALLQYWKDLARAFRESTNDGNVTTEELFPAFLTTLPAGKPESWKLTLDEQQAEGAEKQFTWFKLSRLHGLSYFRLHRPRPMGWAPVNERSWDETDRAKIEAGDLYHSRKWKPIYMDWELQRMDVPWDWKNPEWDEKTAEEYSASKMIYFARSQKTSEMRAARENWLMSEGSN